MTAKEKAKKLVDKFLQAHLKSGGIGMNFNQAKKCATICVDEILSQRHFNVDTTDEVCRLLNYWQEVKQEINNL